MVKPGATASKSMATFSCTSVKDTLAPSAGAYGKKPTKSFDRPGLVLCNHDGGCGNGKAGLFREMHKVIKKDREAGKN